MKQGYLIQTKDPQAVTNCINLMATGVPKEMALRELTINGIEACVRNIGESDSHGVWIVKDHERKNKLSVINTGGDFLSEKVFKDSLATLGMTGNFVGKEQILDSNKGIGAKISYLPKASLGLLYRSIEKGEQFGIYGQMCKSPDGLYHLPSIFCLYEEEKTSWPVCDTFSVYRKRGATTTEVVCMGNEEEEDTWLDFDKNCSLRKATTDGGTGYGIFRYLTHRLWSAPQVPVRVGIYEKKTGELKRLAGVKGLQDFMANTGCKEYGEVKFKLDNLNITAHWAIIKNAGDAGYSSNWSASGYTAVAYKGEVYSDISQHPMSIKKDLNDCGVIVKADKVLIVFEIDEKTELNTSPCRTMLYVGDQKIDKNILHAAFRENFPQKLKDWQEQNQVENQNSKDLMKQIAKDLKEMGFRTPPGGKSGVNSAALKVTRTSSDKKHNGKNPANKGPKKSRAAKKISSSANLRNYANPEVIYIDDETEPLLKFHFRDYALCLNVASPVYRKRRARIILQLGEVCVVRETLEYELKRKMVIHSMYAIFSSNESYAE